MLTLNRRSLFDHFDMMMDPFPTTFRSMDLFDSPLFHQSKEDREFLADTAIMKKAEKDDDGNGNASSYCFSSSSTFMQSADGKIRRSTTRSYKDSTGRKKHYENSSLGEIKGEEETEQFRLVHEKDTENERDSMKLTGVENEDAFRQAYDKFFDSPSLALEDNEKEDDKTVSKAAERAAKRLSRL
eukprot:g2281.t1